MVFKKIKGIRHTLNFCVLKNLWLRSFVVGILFILVLQITQGATQADINELIKQDGEQTRKKIDEKFDNFYKDTETFISSEISKLDNMFKSGQKGISTFISTLISILIWALIIGLVIFVFYFLFIYEKLINVTFEIYKNIEEEGRISKADNLNYLWLGGDTEHKAKRIGKIIGYSKRKNFKTIGSNKKMKIFQNESCLIIKTILFIMKEKDLFS